jgi:hypothetical protein
MTETINAYLDAIQQPWQEKICRRLHEMVQDAIPDAEQRIQYRKPHYLKNGKYAAVFGTAKGWVSLTIFNAAELQPPVGMFESSENGDRITIKIKQDQDVDYALLGDLLRQAASHKDVI